MPNVNGVNGVSEMNEMFKMACALYVLYLTLWALNPRQQCFSEKFNLR